MREITSAAAGNEHVQEGIHNLAKGCGGHPTPPLQWRRGKNVRKELSFQGTQSLEAPDHSFLLHGGGNYNTEIVLSGINS
jgi:hypothetical protein